MDARKCLNLIKEIPMQVNVFDTLVNAAGEILRFSCIIHRTEKPEERLLEPEFYDKWNNGKQPEGVHYELEVVLPGPHLAWPEGVPLHIHENPTTGKRLVCWPTQLKDDKAAWKIFMIWSVGTSYSYKYRQDFGPHWGKANNSVNTFLSFMYHDFDVKSTWTNAESAGLAD